MCGRMMALTYDEALEALRGLEAGIAVDLLPDRFPAPSRKDAFPQSWVPVVVPAQAFAKELEVRVLSWGYPVEWQVAPVFNTRIESMLQGSGMWRESAERRRCLVPVAGFYERHGSETVLSAKSGRPVKRHYGFRLADEPITWLAAIYEDDHFSIVTTKPSAQVRSVHDRMPLVLRQREVPLWLGEGYARLADRSGVVLEVRPERVADEISGGVQPALF